jgi:hypothetical protein
MKLHPTVIDKLLLIFANEGGYDQEKRLLNALQNMRLSIYSKQEGESVLVETDVMLKEATERRLPIGNIITMCFYGGSIMKIVEIYKSFSGHSMETKLVNGLKNLDFTPYHTTSGITLLVLTEQYIKTLQGVQ